MVEGFLSSAALQGILRSQGGTITDERQIVFLLAFLPSLIGVGSGKRLLPLGSVGRVLVAERLEDVYK